MTTASWITTEIEIFARHLDDEGKGNRTKAAYVSDVTQFLEYCDVHGALTVTGSLEPRAAEWLNRSKDLYGSATISRRKSSVKSYFRLVCDMDVLTRYKAPSAPPGVAHPLPNLMDDVRAMIAATKPRSDIRLAIALMGFAGLRVTEARSLCWRDIESFWVTINGKGGKIRRVPIAPELRVIIDQHHCPNVSFGVMIEMTDRGVRTAVTRAGERAGITRPVSSHDLRMTFGTVVYQQTKDLRATQELLGHANPQTTALYTGISDETKQLAMAAALP